MEDNARGTLRLLEVPAGCEEGVARFLARFYQNKTPQQIIQLISSPPVTLSREVPQGLAQKVLTELTALGATGQFLLPEAANPSEKNRPEPPGSGQEKSPKSRPAPLEEILPRVFRPKSLRFPVSLFYRLGLLVVVFAMVLLPLIYITLVAGLGCLIYWHATVNLELFHTVRSARGALFAYAGPLIVGVLLFFFMIKPLFARHQDTWQETEILPKAEPLLRDFIKNICRCIGAPLPTRIRFDNQVNASASFRRGFASFFGNDLVLTIGLPLVGCLNLKEFAGILAHEFGHFAQASGMRLTYLIRSINAWFARVVYEEDAWDLRLRQWSKEIDFRIGLFFYLARFFIWLTRRLLWVLMQAGQIISCFMLRQMEFDADRYEAGLVGCDTFAATFGKLPLVAVAHSQAFAEINQAWKKGRLPDNLTAMVELKLDQIDEQTRRAIQEQQLSLKTGFLETHPADGARIASAKGLDVDPLLVWPGEEIPGAAVLFKDFPSLSRRLTLEHYRLCLGHTPDRQSLVDVSEVARFQSVENHFAAALGRYFFNNFNPRRPLRLPWAHPQAPDDPKSALKQLKIVRQKVLRSNKEHAAALEKHSSLMDRLRRIGHAHCLLDAGFSIQAQPFSLPKATKEGAEIAENRCLKMLAESDRVLRELEDSYRERLQLALGLLQVPAVKKALVGEDSTVEKIAGYWQSMATLQEQLPAVEKIESSLSDLLILAKQLEDTHEKESLITAVRNKMNNLSNDLEELRRRLDAADYPFDHARNGLTLGSYLVSEVPRPEDLGGCFDAAAGTVQNTTDLAARLAGRLAETAQRVERVLSLPDLNPAGD